MSYLVSLIINPVAKGSSMSKVYKAIDFIKSEGFDVHVSFTKKSGDAEYLAKEHVKSSPYIIIAGGGDGTFNEVINGCAFTDIPVGILPFGTTNVLAKELNIPNSIKGALKIALYEKPKYVSLGKIESPTRNRYFVLMAGIGYDGEAVYGINKNIKKISGKGAYILSGIKTLLTFRPEKLSIKINGNTYYGYSIIVGNASKYGGNFKITPDACLLKNNLYVCIFNGNKKLDIVRYILGIITNTHLKFKDIIYTMAEKLEINGNARVQIDGDYFGTTPLKINIINNAVKLVF